MSDERMDGDIENVDPALHDPAPEVEDVVFPDLSEAEEVGAAGSATLDRLMDVSMTVTVELGRRTMQIQEVLNLGVGSVLELDRDSTEPIDILVNGKHLAKGEVVVVGDNFGVRLTSLTESSDRVRRAG